MTFNYTESIEWMRTVLDARESILNSKREPTKMLIDLFELYEGDFDVRQLEQRAPELYKILKTFCACPLTSDDELITNSAKLVKYFDKYRESVRHDDIHLFYAILNFEDMLKQKRIYFKIILQP